MLKVNEKWARKNIETTSRRLRLRISVSTDLKDDGEGDDDRGRSPTPSSCLDGRKRWRGRRMVELAPTKENLML